MYLRSKFMKMLNCLALFFALCFALTISQVYAAVIIDTPASTNADSDNLGITTLSWSHTVGSNISRVLYVSVSTSATIFPGSAVPRVSDVNYGGTPLALVGTQISGDLISSVEIYRLVNPPSGTDTITVNLLLGTTNYVIGGGTSYSGVDLTNPNGTFTSATGISDTPTIIVPDGISGDIILDTLSVTPNAGFFGFGAGQTLRWQGRTTFGAFDSGAGSTEPAMSPVTMSWQTSNVGNWALAGIAIKSLVSTAAESDISGQIKTFSGRPIPYTRITLQNLETGEMFYRTSNHFGFYNFENLETGDLYEIRVQHGRYTFSPNSQIIQIYESLTDVDFIGSPFGANKNQVFGKRRFR